MHAQTAGTSTTKAMPDGPHSAKHCPNARAYSSASYGLFFAPTEGSTGETVQNAVHALRLGDHKRCRVVGCDRSFIRVYLDHIGLERSMSSTMSACNKRLTSCTGASDLCQRDFVSFNPTDLVYSGGGTPSRTSNGTALGAAFRRLAAQSGGQTVGTAA